MADTGGIYVAKELYAKVTSRPLTALKTSSKCSFIPYKLRFLVSFRLVMEHVRLLHEALKATQDIDDVIIPHNIRMLGF